MRRSVAVSAMLIVLATLCVLAFVLAGRGQRAESSRGGGTSQEREPGSRIESNAPRGENAGRKRCGPNAPTSNVSPSPSFDGANEVKLIRVSDNAFVGRVVEKIRDVPPPETETDLPVTEFAVRVEENIKGSLSGTVTVAQGGGCDLDYGSGITLVNNDSLLKPGQRVLFTTTRDAPGGPHSLTMDRFSNVVLETEAEEERLVAKFERAASKD